MLIIKKLRIRLPAGNELRAQRIARAVGEALAMGNDVQWKSARHVSVPPLSVHSHATDHDIAADIVHGISAAMKENDK